MFFHDFRESQLIFILYFSPKVAALLMGPMDRICGDIDIGLAESLVFDFSIISLSLFFTFSAEDKDASVFFFLFFLLLLVGTAVFFLLEGFGGASFFLVLDAAAWAAAALAATALTAAAFLAW
jgi:hypothetical protein